MLAASAAQQLTRMKLPTHYHASASFYSQRTRLAFAEKKVQHKQVELVLHADENLEPWYVYINPLMLVPVFTSEDGVKVIESEGIIYHLDLLTPELPKLYPDKTTSEGARCLHYIKLIDTVNITKLTDCTLVDGEFTKGVRTSAPNTVKDRIAASISKANRYAEKYKPISYVYLNKAAMQSERLKMCTVNVGKRLVEEIDLVKTVLDQVETALNTIETVHRENPAGERPWLCCQHFTAADIYLATLLHRLSFLGYSHFWTDGKRPQVEQYYQRILKRESFRKTCLYSNSVFWAMMYPLIKYKIRHSFPWLLGVSAVLGGAMAYFCYRKC